MHMTQVDLGPIGSACGEISFIDGAPSDRTASIAILDRTEPLDNAGRCRTIHAPRRHVWQISDMTLTGMTSADCTIASSLAKAPLQGGRSAAPLAN